MIRWFQKLANAMSRTSSPDEVESRPAVFGKHPMSSHSFTRLMESTLNLIRHQIDASYQLESANEFLGDLILAKTRLRWLPGNLHVKGLLDLRQCQRFHGFQEGSLTVDGDLFVGGKFPESWTDKTLPGEWYRKFIAGTERQANFGDRLFEFLSRDSLDSTCPIKTLPNPLNVGGDLVLVRCHELAALPMQILVANSITIVGAAIQQIGRIDEVHGDLRLCGCPISELPEQLRVHGDATLDGLRLKQLPAGLRVEGNLNLVNCKDLTQLPDDLIVGGRLNIVGCPISKLSRTCQIGRGIRFKLCSIDRLDLPQKIPGTLSINACRKLKSIHGVEVVEGNMSVIDGVELIHLPEKLTINGRLVLDRCRILERLPETLEIRARQFPWEDRNASLRWISALSLVGCQNVTRLPNMKNVKGSVDLADCGVEDLTDEELEGLQVRWRGVPIEARYLFRPKKIRPEEVFGQRNAEVRRVMLERMGTQRLMQMTSSRVVDSDQDAGGLRRLIYFRISQAWGREEYHFLNCFCPSTGREYLLQVPMTVVTCHAAAAWLAGFDEPDDYQPIVET